MSTVNVVYLQANETRIRLLNAKFDCWTVKNNAKLDNIEEGNIPADKMSLHSTRLSPSESNDKKINQRLSSLLGKNLRCTFGLAYFDECGMVTTA